jgi:dTDP-4-dehydrorhamnose 3,5-epimerase
MIVQQTGIDGLIVLKPRCFRDNRGFFLESFQSERYAAAGVADAFVQDNHSRSSRGVVRGLHFQVNRPQAQLVTILRGRVYDVAVDLRSASPSFGCWYGVELSDEEPSQIYMPPGFAHGFCVLSDFADLYYKVSRHYDRHDDGGVVWNDPDLGITWPVAAPLISERDAAFPRLRELTSERLPSLSLVERS